MNPFERWGGHSLAAISDIAFSPTGQLIASASNDDTVSLWDAKTGRLVRQFESFPGSGTPGCITFNQDGSQIAVCRRELIKVVETHTGRELAELKGHRGEVIAASFSPNGRYLVTGGQDKVARIWDLARTEQESVRKLSLENLYDGSLSAAAKHGVVWDRQNVAYFARDPFVEKSLPVKSRDTDGAVVARMGGVVISPDGKTVIVAQHHNDSLQSIDVRTLTVRWEISGISVLHGFSSDGTRVAVAKRGATVILNAKDGNELHLLPAAQTSAFDPTSNFVALGVGKELRLWDPKGAKEVLSISLDHMISSIAVQKDLIATLSPASSDGSVKLWDRTNGELLQTISPGGYSVGVFFTPESRRLVTFGMSGRIQLWDPVIGQETLSLQGFSEHCDAGVSVTGEEIVALGIDGSIQSWAAIRSSDF